MAIVAAHMLLYTPEAEAVRAVLRDVFEWNYVEDHPGWLIFALPPSEVAVHPSEVNDRHELYLMTDDIEGFVAEMKKRHLACAPVENQGWGLLTQVTLPGGGKLSVYEPRHARPTSAASAIL